MGYLRQPEVSHALMVGDYLQVGTDRFGARVTTPGEQYARIERVEHVIGEDAIDVGRNMIHAGPFVTAVFCHGLPGPVLLEPGDHFILPDLPARLSEHDCASGAWSPTAPAVFTRGAFLADPSPARTQPPPSHRRPSGDGNPSFPVRQQARRAATFTVPAVELAVADYLQIQTCPGDATMDVDEGYARVEWVGHLDPAIVGRIFADPAWRRGPITAVAVFGLSGLLLIPDRQVRLLVAPNVERVADECAGPWLIGERPRVQIAGTRELETTAREKRDARLRPAPPADEQDLYRSAFATEAEREMHLHGRDGLRLVPMSALPFPGRLFRCAHVQFADALRDEYSPDPKRLSPREQAEERAIVNADLLTRLSPEDFAACRYHTADWALIAAVTAELFERYGHDADAAVAAIEVDERLDDAERRWAADLLADPIIWRDGGEGFVNGQHRSCALRAAGVLVCPVAGRHLPGAVYPPPLDPRADAEKRVDAYWRARTEQPTQDDKPRRRMIFKRRRNTDEPAREDAADPGTRRRGRSPHDSSQQRRPPLPPSGGMRL